MRYFVVYAACGICTVEASFTDKDDAKWFCSYKNANKDNEYYHVLSEFSVVNIVKLMSRNLSDQN